MKKNTLLSSKQQKIRKSLPMTMLFLALNFVFLTNLSANIYSQTAKFTVKYENITVKEVFDKLESVSKFRFFYNDSFIDLDRIVSIDTNDQGIDEIMNKLFSESSITYEILDNERVVITPKKSASDLLVKQQKKTITGIVVDEKRETVIGASIKEKGTPNGTMTDIDGSFSLEVDTDATLVISYIGYIIQEISVGGKNILEIQLESDIFKLEEVVVTGYGMQKKASLTGSISSVKVDDEMRSLSSSNMSSMLAGTMAGLRVNSPTGVPGTSSKLTIRSASSFNATPPIFVIDGVVRDKSDFDRLDVNEVDNITILKDAASAAIYGSRSSGGVVLVSTRSGKIGKPQIRYTGSYAIESRGIEMERTSGIETAELANYIHRNDPTHWTYWDEQELAHMRSINNGQGYDVIDEYWKTPMSTHHSLGLTGGNEKVKYFINASYFGQKGFLERMDYSRYNVRANLETAVNKHLKIITQLSSSYADRNNITYGFGEDMSNIYTHIRCIQPEMKSRTSDGKPIDWGWIGNIGEFSNKANSGYNKDETQISELLLRLEYSIPFVEELKVKGQFAYNYNNAYNKTFNKKQDLYQVKKEGTNGHIWTDEIIGLAKSSEPSKEYIRQSSNRNRDYQFNFQVDYARTFGKHDISALFVYEQREGWLRNFSGGRENFPVLIKDQWFATSSARNDSYVDGRDAEDGRLSYVGQVNYGYDNKYLLNASLRVDGSMNFPPGKKYGYFPAVSGAWVISRENFFKSETIQQLKLRASLGWTGYDGVIGWQWQESYKYGSSAFLGSAPAINPGIQSAGVVNPNITWEKAMSYNIGLDLYWTNHLTFSTDFWSRNTYDILGGRILSIPTTFGFPMPKENYGKVKSHGIDLEIGYNNKVMDFSYYAKGVFSFSTNKVKVQDYPSGAPDYDNPIGRPLNYIKGYRDDGIIRTQQQLDDLNNHYKEIYGAGHEYTVFGHKTELGMLVYKDLSGPSGKPDGKIDSYDQDVLFKHSVPPFTTGLTLGVEWKGVSIETLLQGDFGYKRGLDSRYLGMNEWNRMPRKWLDHWSIENPDGKFPDPKSADSFKSYYQVSTFTLKDASFVKMRYLNVGYSLPKPFLESLNFIGMAKIFFSATNLFTISGFDYWDPELASTASYPNMKTFNFGVDITF